MPEQDGTPAWVEVTPGDLIEYRSDRGGPGWHDMDYVMGIRGNRIDLEHRIADISRYAVVKVLRSNIPRVVHQNRRG